jgi:hypothetical protein
MSLAEHALSAVLGRTVAFPAEPCPPKQSPVAQPNRWRTLGMFNQTCDLVRSRAAAEVQCKPSAIKHGMKATTRKFGCVTEPNPSDHTNGRRSKRSCELEGSEANRVLTRSNTDDLLHGRRHTFAGDFDDDNYIQHSPVVDPAWSGGLTMAKSSNRGQDRAFPV